MKKTGIVTIILIILVIAVTSGTSYAFFSAGSVEFSIFIEGVKGSELSIELTTEQNKILKPAKTSALNNIYTAASTSDRDFAMYELDYASGATETIDVYYSVVGVEYIVEDGSQLEDKYADFLNNYVKYAFLWEKKEDGTQILTKDDALSSVGSLDWQSDWKKSGNETTKHTVQTESSGKLYCFVAIDSVLTDELIPMNLNKIKIKFTITTRIVKPSESSQT